MEELAGVGLTLADLDRYVGTWRREHVYNASYIPPHISLLRLPSSFRTPIGKEDLKSLQNVVREFASFEVRFQRFAKFGGEVLYLVPEDGGEITRLHRKLVDTFEPPEDIFPFTPHLTVAFQPRKDLDVIQKEMELEVPFPIQVTARVLSLFYGSLDGSWRQVREFGLGAYKPPEGTPDSAPQL